MDEKKTVQLSVSQIETYRSCPRKWWIGSVKKIRPEFDNKAQVFGDVLHAVVGRYQSADELGRDRETGEEVDLYPKDWEYTMNRWTGEPTGHKVTLAEQALIKKLVNIAIEKGYLQRHPQGIVEHEVQMDIMETDEVVVKLIGFIDYAVPDRVVDHKTAKDTRYLKSDDPNSPNWLGRETQMIAYSPEVMTARDTPVTLTHNQFIKEAEDVRQINVTVTPDEIEAGWNKIIETSTEMLRVREIKHWPDTPGPREKNACRKYGGCPYQTVCGGVESLETLSARLDTVGASKYTGSTSTQSETTDMSQFQARLAAMKAAKTGPAQGDAAPAPVNPPAAAQPATPAPAPAAPAAAPAQADDGFTVPPWTNDQCQACKDEHGNNTGFSTIGEPCRICDMFSKQAGGKTSADFDLTMTPEGVCVWQEKNGDLVGQSKLPQHRDGEAPAARPETPPAASKPAAPAEQPPAPNVVRHTAQSALSALAKAKQQPAAPAEEPAKSEQPEQPPQDAQEAQEPAQKTADPIVAFMGGEKVRMKGTPVLGGMPDAEKSKKAFCLAINIESSAGKHATVDLHEAFSRYTQALAEAAGVESWWDISAFDRRDMLSKAAPLFAEEFGTKIVTVSGVGTGETDLSALVTALRPLASTVLVGSPR